MHLIFLRLLFCIFFFAISIALIDISEIKTFDFVKFLASVTPITPDPVPKSNIFKGKLILYLCNIISINN